MKIIYLSPWWLLIGGLVTRGRNWTCGKRENKRPARPTWEGAWVSKTEDPWWRCGGDQALHLVLPGSVFIGTGDVILYVNTILQWAAGNQRRSQAHLHQCGGSHYSPPHTSAIEQQLIDSLATDQMIKICHVLQNVMTWLYREYLSFNDSIEILNHGWLTANWGRKIKTKN